MSCASIGSAWTSVASSGLSSRRPGRPRRGSRATPGARLRGLHDAIRRHDPSLDIEPTVAELPRELDTSASPPLTGRDDELRRLRAHWQRAAAGAGALVTLVGAYGMGKTRMAAELAAAAHREGAAVA